jgi:hypothetical protein
MANRVVVTLTCDVCALTHKPNSAPGSAQTVTVSLNGSPAREVELCELHESSATLAQLRTAMAKFGRASTKGRVVARSPRASSAS